MIVRSVARVPGTFNIVARFHRGPLALPAQSRFPMIRSLMENRTTSTCFVVAAALFVTGCAQAAAKQTQAPVAVTSATIAVTSQTSPSPASSVAAVVRTMKKSDGLFTVYQDTTNGSLMMSVPKNKIGKEFIYFTHVVDAPVDAGAFRGSFGTTTFSRFAGISTASSSSLRIHRSGSTPTMR